MTLEQYLTNIDQDQRIKLYCNSAAHPNYYSGVRSAATWAAELPLDTLGAAVISTDDDGGKINIAVDYDPDGKRNF